MVGGVRWHPSGSPGRHLVGLHHPVQVRPGRDHHDIGGFVQSPEHRSTVPVIRYRWRGLALAAGAEASATYWRRTPSRLVENNELSAPLPESWQGASAAAGGPAGLGPAPGRLAAASASSATTEKTRQARGRVGRAHPLRQSPRGDHRRGGRGGSPVPTLRARRGGRARATGGAVCVARQTVDLLLTPRLQRPAVLEHLGETRPVVPCAPGMPGGCRSSTTGPEAGPSTFTVLTGVLAP